MRMISSVFIFLFLFTVSIPGEEIEDLSQHPGLTNAIKRYYESVDKAKGQYESSLRKSLETARKAGNLAAFNALEAEIEHTTGKTGHRVSRFTPTERSLLNRKLALKRAVDDARNDFRKAAGKVASEFLKAGRIDLARDVESLAKLDEPPRYYIDETTIEISSPHSAPASPIRALLADKENGPKTVDVSKYLASVPKGKTSKSITPGGGHIWMHWAFCVSITPDDKTLVLSRFEGEKWLLSYDLRSDRFGPIFEAPDKNQEVTYHVISPKSPGKCYVGFNTGLLCEYDIASGKILRRAQGKGYPDELLLNRNGDKLYFGGHPSVWDLKTDRVTEIEVADGNTFALDGEENRLAVGYQDRNEITIFDTASHRSVATVPAPAKIIRSLRFTRDGRGLLIGTEEPPTLTLHSFETGKSVFSITGFAGGRISSAFFNAEETLLFVVCSKHGWCDPPVLVFDTKTLLPVQQYSLGEMCGARNAVLTSDERFLIPGTCRSVRLCEVPDRPTVRKNLESLKTVK